MKDEDKTVESVEEEMPLEAALKERRTELQVSVAGWLQFEMLHIVFAYFLIRW